MEPMNLGSPTHQHTSPSQLSSPSSHHQGTGGGYLPGYLMGDTYQSPSPSVTASPLFSRQLSSPKQHQHSQSFTSVGAPVTPLPNRGPALLRDPHHSGRLHSRSEKPGGPPTAGLMSGSTPIGLGSPYTRFDNSGVFTPSKTREISTQEETEDPLAVWVTVFGFPPQAAQFVLSQISTCGTVLQHTQPPQSNWMHVRFQTRLQARKALDRNATVIGGNIMIGVNRCTDDTVLDPNNTSLLDASSSMVGSGVANLSSAFGTPRTIRPLTQAYKEAQVENKIAPSHNTPNKDSGIVSAAMGYMFGW